MSEDTAMEDAPAGGSRRLDARRERISHRRPRGLVGRPSAHASIGYRLLRVGLHGVGRGMFGFRPELVGVEHLPRAAGGRQAGGWIAAGLPHRTWVDPFLVADLLPVRPRLFFFGDGRTIYRAWWRRALVRWIGGVIPIWPGGGRSAVEAHLVAAAAVLSADGVLVLFPEVGPPVPPGTARPLGLGVAYFALRTGAPIVPLAIGGSDELYRGRRLRVEVLEPVTARELAGLPVDGPLPRPWSREERAAAHAIVAGLHARCAPAVAAVQAAVQPAEGTRKRWSWLTTAWH